MDSFKSFKLTFKTKIGNTRCFEIEKNETFIFVRAYDIKDKKIIVFRNEAVSFKEASPLISLLLDCFSKKSIFNIFNLDKLNLLKNDNFEFELVCDDEVIHLKKAVLNKRLLGLFKEIESFCTTRVIKEERYIYNDKLYIFHKSWFDIVFIKYTSTRLYFYLKEEDKKIFFLCISSDGTLENLNVSDDVMQRLNVEKKNILQNLENDLISITAYV